MKRSEATRVKPFNQPLETFQAPRPLPKLPKTGAPRMISQEAMPRDVNTPTSPEELGFLGKRKSRNVELPTSCKKPCIRKKPWTPEEDAALTKLVESIGNQKWSDVARVMPGREGKQCRERWHNHLSPSIKKSSWTDQEQWILFLSHKQLGNKWSRISTNLVGRTDNSIKNHWNSMMRRKIPEFKEKLDALFVKSSAKNNKSLQADIINQELEKQKKALFSEVQVLVLPPPQPIQRVAVLAQPVHMFATVQPSKVRKSSSGGSTNDDNYEESKPKNIEISSEAPFLFMGEGVGLHNLGLGDRLENFPDDLQAYDYSSFGLPIQTHQKREPIRTGFEEFLDESGAYARSRNPFSRDNSANGSSEKGFTLAYHNYDSTGDLEY